MLTREHWISQETGLSIGGPSKPLVPGPNISPLKWTQEKNRLEYDGHFVFESAFPEESLASLRTAASKLVELGYPAIFLSVFDEFWRMVARLQPIGEGLLEEKYMIFPDYWVWHIDNKKKQSGWKPHREQKVDIDDPNLPTQSISLWVSLSKATTDNGCMYVLPKSKDRGYPHTLKFDITTLQDVKALPVPAGSVIGWNQSVFHWGASNSIEASEPRVSFAMELRRVSRADDIPFMMPSDFFPSFEQRLRLVAMQFVNYKHLHGCEPRFMDFAYSVLGPDYVAR